MAQVRVERPAAFNRFMDMMDRLAKGLMIQGRQHSRYIKSHGVTELKSSRFRIVYFSVEGKYVFTHGFVKPPKKEQTLELDRARRLMERYQGDQETAI